MSDTEASFTRGWKDASGAASTRASIAKFTCGRSVRARGREGGRCGARRALLWDRTSKLL